jgi:hypothetical protein
MIRILAIELLITILLLISCDDKISPQRNEGVP